MADELTIELWRRVSRALDELLELEPERRGDFLAQICSDDPLLLWWTRALLEAEAEAGDFMERSAASGTAMALRRFLLVPVPSPIEHACSQVKGHSGGDETGARRERDTVGEDPSGGDEK